MFLYFDIALQNVGAEHSPHANPCRSAYKPKQLAFVKLSKLQPHYQSYTKDMT